MSAHKLSCQVTLDISGIPIDFQGAPGNIQGNFDSYVQSLTYAIVLCMNDIVFYQTTLFDFNTLC